MSRRIVNTQTGLVTVDSDFVKPDWTTVSVPFSVTKRQLMLACKETAHAGSNWWALATTAIAAASQDVQDEWNFANVIERDNTTFLAFTASLGATSTDVDNVFRLAETK